MRLTLRLVCIFAALALVGCTSNREGEALLTQAPETPTPAQSYSSQAKATPVTEPTAEAVPTLTLLPAATPVPTASPVPTFTPVPTALPTPTLPPTPTNTPTLVPTPTPLPTATMVPRPTLTLEPLQVAVSVPLAGVAREQSPLFSYENEQVYDEVRALVSGQNSFVADFYRHLAQEEEGNLFYSPYSLYTAMAVVYAGAAGSTAAEFQDVMGIGVPSDRFHRNLNSLDLTLLNDSVRPGEEDTEAADSRPTLSVANGLWIQDGLEVRPGFLNTVTANYGMVLAQLDFRKAPKQAVEAINQWVDEATQGKIKQAIGPTSITDDTSLVVTNAVYFKGDWEDQFEEENTTDQPFYLLDRLVVQVPMMYQSNNYYYRLGEGYQAVELPYTSGYSMLVVMPDEGTFAAFEESLTGERLQSLVEDLSGGKVILRMPRFKLEHGFSAKKGLQALGLTEAFDRESADFSPIAERLFGLPVEELWIEDAVQKAFVEVNEEGSEAAAVTAFVGGGIPTSSSPPPVEITIDRPFIFLLRHSQTGAVLFMGRVLNPDPEAPATVGTRPPPTPTPAPREPAPPPAIFYGVATLDGTPAPPGTEIKAFDGDREIGRAIVSEDAKFTLMVGMSEGPITFKVGGVDALEKVRAWQGGNITGGFNLHAANP